VNTFKCLGAPDAVAWTRKVSDQICDLKYFLFIGVVILTVDQKLDSEVAKQIIKVRNSLFLFDESVRAGQTRRIEFTISADVQHGVEHDACRGHLPRMDVATIIRAVPKLRHAAVTSGQCVHTLCGLG
jgi:methyl coenzyme M reductase subunit D